MKQLRRSSVTAPRCFFIVMITMTCCYRQPFMHQLMSTKRIFSVNCALIGGMFAHNLHEKRLVDILRFSLYFLSPSNKSRSRVGSYFTLESLIRRWPPPADTKKAEDIKPSRVPVYCCTAVMTFSLNLFIIKSQECSFSKFPRWIVNGDSFM